MFVQCLGSGEAFSSGGRLNSSFLIKTKTQGVLLDCGASTLIALKKANLSSHDIDIIVLSHLHGDHFSGIPFIICERQVAGDQNKSLTIIGPEQTEQRVRLIMESFFPDVYNRISFPLHFIQYSDQQVLDINGITLKAFKAIHSPVTNPHSLRVIIENVIIAYSGDTEWNDNLIEASKSADLFICEAYAYYAPVKTHMWLALLLENLNRLSAKKIFLTHLGKDALNNVAHIPLPIANDGEILWSN